MTQHSPLPWKSFAPKFKAGRGIGPSSKWIVARTTPCRDGEGQHHSKANAALIIKAVNNHENLVKLLKEIRQWMDNDIGPWDVKFIAEIDAALKSAGTE